jgi:tetratricopeptide (TPR) repeat protein
MPFDINSSILMKTVFTCKSSGKLDDAKNFLDIAAKYNFEVSTLDEIAYLQNEIKDYTNSITTLRKCLALSQNPQEHYAIRANLAKMYNHLNEPLLSLGYSNANLEVSQGKDYDTLMEIAFSHYLHGDYDKSESMMRELNDQQDLPDNIRGRVLYNLGSYDIERGFFKRGLSGFIDVGHKIGIWTHREKSMIPLWDGSKQEDKTVLIHAEGGIGDEIICVRFMDHIKRMGMNPVWYTNNHSLVEVFNNNGFKCVSDLNDIDLSDAVQCMAMYLPILLKLDKDQLWEHAYLRASEKYLDKWRKILPAGPKLACKWTGNPHYEQDLHRSLSLDFINDLCFSGTKINLQLELENEQPNMFNAGSIINNIEDTLAILTLCDYTVTSCTSIAHMIGALGVKGSVCPPIASYYVWLGMKDNKSDWYSENLKVFRQKKHKDWSCVFEDVQKTIRENNAQ